MSTTAAKIHPEEQQQQHQDDLKKKPQRTRCRFFNRSGGCKNKNCPFLHTTLPTTTNPNNEKPKKSPKNSYGGKRRQPKNEAPRKDSPPDLNNHEDPKDESLYGKEPQCPRTRKIDEKNKSKRATSAPSQPHTTELNEEQFSPSNNSNGSIPATPAAKKKKQPNNKKTNKKCMYGAKCNDKKCKYVHPLKEKDAKKDRDEAAEVESTHDSTTKTNKIPPKQSATTATASFSKETNNAKNIPCRYGNRCLAKKACKFLHPDEVAAKTAQTEVPTPPVTTDASTTTATKSSKKEGKKVAKNTIEKTTKEEECHHPSSGNHGNSKEENNKHENNSTLNSSPPTPKKEGEKEKPANRKKNKKCKYGEKCRDQNCAFQHPSSNSKPNSKKSSQNCDTMPMQSSHPNTSDRKNENVVNTAVIEPQASPAPQNSISQETKLHREPQQPQITDSNIDQLLFGEGSNEVWDHLDQQLHQQDDVEKEKIHKMSQQENGAKRNHGKRSQHQQQRQQGKDVHNRKAESSTRNKGRAKFDKKETKDATITAAAVPPTCEETKIIQDNADAVIREALELQEEFKALSEQKPNDDEGTKRTKSRSKKQGRSTNQHAKHDKENISNDSINKKEKAKMEREEMLRKKKEQETRRKEEEKLRRKQKELETKRLKEEEERRKELELEAKRLEEERERAAEALAAEQARKAKEEEEMLKRKQKEEEEKQRRKQKELEAKRLREEEQKRKQKELEAKRLKEEEEKKREEAFAAEQAQKAKLLEEQKLARAEKLRKEKEAARLKKAKSEEKRMMKAKQQKEERVRYWENDQKFREDFAYIMTQFCTAEVKRLGGVGDGKYLDSDLVKEIEDQVSTSYNRMYPGSLKVKVTLPVNKQYHNRIGEIIGWDEGKQKYKIGLETKKQNVEYAFLLPENLEHLEDTHSATAKKRRKCDNTPEDGAKIKFDINHRSFEVSRVLVDKLRLVYKLEPNNLDAKIQQEMAERRRAEEEARRRREEELKRQRELYEKQMKWEKEMREERQRQRAAEEEQARRERAARKEAKKAARRNPYDSFGFGGGGFSFFGGGGMPRFIRIIGPDGRPAIFVLDGDSDDEDYYDGYFDEDYYDYEEDDEEDNGPSAEEHAEALGVDVDAPMKDIKKAFRQKALKYHPDKHQSHVTDMTHDEAEEYFKKCTAAYEFFNNMHHG